MIQLRDYQQKMANDLRDGYRAGFNRQLLVSPTGSGKTCLFSYISKGASEKGSQVMVIAPRVEIIHQVSKTLSNFNVDHGIIAAGWKYDPRKLVHVASAQTLVNRFDSVKRPSFIVIDECHRSAANTWVKIFAQYHDAKFLGVTATPQRLDGKGLGELYTNLVLGPSVQWLIDQGFLARPRYFAPETSLDFSGVRTSMGDFEKKEIEGIVDRPSIVGDAVSHYRRHIFPGTAVAFCISLAHCEHVAESFRASGIRSQVIDGKLSDEDRAARMAGLASGNIQVLCSCEILGEGVDVPSVGGCILLRPTKSLALHLQQVGRCLRPKPDNNTAVILDHVGNTLRLGLSEEPRDWSLEGNASKRRPKEAVLETRQCAKCFAVYQGTVCPECGVERKSKVREIEEREGELREIAAKEMEEKRAARVEVAKARTYQDLQAIAKARGYAPGWAWHRWKISKHNPANRRKEGVEIV